MKGTNSVYTYSSNDTEENLIKITKKVCSLLKRDGNDIYRPVCELEKSLLRAEKYFSQISYSQKMNLINQVIAAGKNYDTKVKRMWVRYLDQEQNIVIANSEGLYREDSRNKTRMLITAYAEKDGDTQSGYIGPGAAKGFEFYDEIDVDA